MAADQRIAESLARYREAVQEYKAELLAEQGELEVLIAQLEAERAQLQVEEAALELRIAEVEALIEAQEIEQAELQAAYERASERALLLAQGLGALDEERQAAIRELERQVQEGGGSIVVDAPARPGHGSFIWPSSFTSTVSSPFGPRWGTMHLGIDIATPGINGTNILAAASGVVSFSGWMSGFGNTVMINHGNGYVTLYAHNSANLVSLGQEVVQGQVIALVGSTGFSTGPHIHFEIIRNGQHVDPMIYF